MCIIIDCGIRIIYFQHLIKIPIILTIEFLHEFFEFGLIPAHQDKGNFVPVQKMSILFPNAIGASSQKHKILGGWDEHGGSVGNDCSP